MKKILFFASMLTFMGAGAFAQEADVCDGLITHFTFNETDFKSDDGISKLVLTEEGSNFVYLNDNGDYEYGRYLFDMPGEGEEKHLELRQLDANGDTIPMIAPVSDRTVAFWIKFNQWNYAGKRIFSYGDSSYDGMIFGLRTSSPNTDPLGNKTLYFEGGGTTQFNAGNILPVAEWIHLAVVYDYPMVKVYLNGDLVREEELYLNTNESNIIHLGKSNDNALASYDDFRVYNRALSFLEIKKLAEQPEPELCEFDMSLDLCSNTVTQFFFNDESYRSLENPYTKIKSEHDSIPLTFADNDHNTGLVTTNEARRVIDLFEKNDDGDIVPRAFPSGNSERTISVWAKFETVESFLFGYGV